MIKGMVKAGYHGKEDRGLEGFYGSGDLLTAILSAGYFYNLDLPKFPILSPEFSNPLFLKLCCSGISNSGQKDFPSGFNGIYKVFENYIDSIYIKIQSKPEYKLRRRIVWEAIDCFLNQCSEKRKTYLEIEECVDIFSEKFSITPNLLQDLIEEGLFIKSIIYRSMYTCCYDWSSNFFLNSYNT